MSLLHKLEMRGSHRTIVKQIDLNIPIGTEADEIAVVAVTDEECYAGRDPGAMHPETEQFVADLDKALTIVRQRRQRMAAEGCSPR